MKTEEFSIAASRVIHKLDAGKKSKVESAAIKKAAKNLRPPRRRAAAMMGIICENAKFRSPEQALWSAVVGQIIDDFVREPKPQPCRRGGESDGMYAKRIGRWEKGAESIRRESSMAFDAMMSDHFTVLCAAAGTDAEYVIDMLREFDLFPRVVSAGAGR